MEQASLGNCSIYTNSLPIGKKNQKNSIIISITFNKTSEHDKKSKMKIINFSTLRQFLYRKATSLKAVTRISLLSSSWSMNVNIASSSPPAEVGFTLEDSMLEKSRKFPKLCMRANNTKLNNKKNWIYIFQINTSNSHTKFLRKNCWIYVFYCTIFIFGFLVEFYFFWQLESRKIRRFTFCRHFDTKNYTRLKNLRLKIYTRLYSKTCTRGRTNHANHENEVAGQMSPQLFPWERW